MAETTVINYCVPLTDMDPLFLIALFMMTAMVALFFMLGKVFSRTKWEATARYEGRQVVISAILGFALLGLASVSCTVSGFVLKDVVSPPSSFSDQFRHAEQYLNVLINQIGVPSLKSFWALSYGLSASTATLRVEGVKIFPMGSLLQKAIDRVIAPMSSIFVASLNIQLLTVQAAQAFAFTLLLPVGLVLRAIPFTREGGSLLIGLAFGLYVIWPFSFVANYEISKQVWPKLGLEDYAKTLDFHKVASPTIASTTGLLWDIGNNLSLLSLQATVLPLISLTILIAFVRIFSDYINDLR